MAVRRYIKKPSIPSLSGWPEELIPVMKEIKESLEIITGRKGEKIAQLSGTVTVDALAERVNEIIRVMQDGSDTSVAVGLPGGAVAVPPAPAAPQVDLANLSDEILALLGVVEDRYELVLNGNFDLCQRYLSTQTTSLGSGYPSGAYGPDGWAVITYDTGMPADLTWSDGTSAVVTGSDTGPLRNSVRVQRSTGLVSNNQIALVTFVEGYLYRPWRNSEVTVTFKVRSTQTGTYAVMAKISLGSQYMTCPAIYTINVANTWEEKTVTFPVPPATGLIGDNLQRGLGMVLEWIIRGGSGGNLTVGAWAGPGSLSSASRVTGHVAGLATTSDWFDLADVHTEGRRRSYEQTVQLARRYFQRGNPPSRQGESYRDYDSPGGGGNIKVGGNNSGAAGSVSATVQLAPDMRKDPTLLLYAPGVSTLNRVRRVSDGATITPSATAASRQHILVDASMATFTDQRMEFCWAADAGFVG